MQYILLKVIYLMLMVDYSIEISNIFLWHCSLYFLSGFYHRIQENFPTFPPNLEIVNRSVTRGPLAYSVAITSHYIAITSHQYNNTFYTPGHLQISWDVFANKSADIMSFCISFITISTWMRIWWGGWTKNMWKFWFDQFLWYWITR